MSGCTVQRLEAPGLTFLKVSGTVDETFSASQLSGQIRADTILHLGKVTRFSSFGVREWVRLMKDLQGRVKHCILVECSPAVVNQLNVVVDFAAGAHVKSVQLPYACQSCELDKMVTVDVDAQRAELLAGQLPQVPCPQCHNPMVFDDLPSSYLAFLRDAAAPEPGSPMAKFISSFEQAAPALADSDGPPSRPGASAPPVPRGPPPVDPTVPPPGMASAGMPAGAKWAAAAALVILLAGGGYMAFGKRPEPVVPPPPPPTGNGTAEVPKGPPPKRSMAAEESLEMQTMLSAERFSDAEAFISKHESVWLEDSTKKATELVKGARATSCEKYMQQAQVLLKDRKGKQALEALATATAICGESDRSTYNQIVAERTNGNCPEVIRLADTILERYPDSTYLKQSNDFKKACQRAPAISVSEMKRALAAYQSDIDRCLSAPRPPDQAGNSIDLAWTVDPTGAVTQASCTTPSLAKSPLCACLTEQVRRMR